MSYRVQKSFVSQKRSPWIILVLVLAVLAFVGFSMIPLLGASLREIHLRREQHPQQRRQFLRNRKKTLKLKLRVMNRFCSESHRM
jgi:flagellar basal body-associated protein FliL